MKICFASGNIGIIMKHVDIHIWFLVCCVALFFLSFIGNLFFFCICAKSGAWMKLPAAKQAERKQFKFDYLRKQQRGLLCSNRSLCAINIQIYK